MSALALLLLVLSSVVDGFCPIATLSTPKNGRSGASGKTHAFSVRESGTVQDSFRLKDEIDRATLLLRSSDFMYMFVSIREVCILGQSKLPFELLALESDMMPMVQFLNGAPHVHDPFAPGSTYGFTIPDIIFVTLRIISKHGLGDGTHYLGGVAPVSTQVGGERKSSDFLVGEDSIVKCIDLFLRDFAGEDSCARGDGDGSRGVLGRDYNYRYIQGFFDRVYEGAKTDDNFRSVLDELQGNSDYQKTGFGDEGTSRAQPFLKVLSSLNKANSRIMNPTFISPEKMVWINDRKNSEELVYAIFANKEQKKMTVVFRGSVVLKDWLANVNPGTSIVANPIPEDYEGKTDTIEIRKGYWQFLLNPRADNDRNKYDEIADKVYEYGRELGGEFSVEVAGHSLGGALASLFGFYASLDTRFSNNTVKVFTFGASISGKVTFAKAFHHQEAVGRLQHARFVMSEDLVPNMRFMDKDYAHTGHRIELSTNGAVAPAVSYVDDMRQYGTLRNWASSNVFETFSRNVNPVSLVQNHAPGTYRDALRRGILPQEKIETSDVVPEVM